MPKFYYLMIKPGAFKRIAFCFIFIYLFSGNANAQISSCNFTLQDTVGCGSLLVLATANVASPYPITNYTWDVNTVPPLHTTGSTANFATLLSVPGTYTLTLTTTNSNGDVCSYSYNNLVVASNPFVNLTFTATEGSIPFPTQVTANCSANCGTIDSTYIIWGCGSIETFVGCPPPSYQHTYNCPVGCYNPRVIVKNTCGCYFDTTYNCRINIIPKPVANFTASTTTLNCTSAPLTDTLLADSAGPNMIYSWFVNGVLQQTGPGRTFIHQFPVTPICYDVMLTLAHNPPSPGCVDTLLRHQYICVRGAPNLQVTNTSVGNTACVNSTHCLNVLFSNDSADGLSQLTWSPGTPGGPLAPSTAPNYNLNVCNLGTYYMGYCGSFGPGCSTCDTQIINANLRPYASFTQDDSFFCSPPDTVHFHATPCAGCTYAWTFQSGSPATSNLQDPDVVYNTYGTFNTKLIVTSGGCSDTINKLQLIKVNRLNPRILMSREKGCAPLCTILSDTVSLARVPFPVSSVCWSFPNSGIPGACQDTIHRCFVNPQCYDVKVLVTTVNGCRDSVTYRDSLCAGAPPVCTLTVAPDSMCFEADTACFMLACDSFDYVFVDYGDGTSEITHVPQFCHYYQDTGIFHTIVIPYNDSCSGDTLRATVTVFPPIAKFIDSTNCSSQDTIYLVSRSAGADTYNWTIGCTGQTFSTGSPVVVLPTCDTCTITLTVHNNASGCTHHDTHIINTPCNRVSFTPTDTVGCGVLDATYVNTSASIVNTRWHFGATCGLVNPINVGPTRTINATTPGAYCVTMENTSASGCKDTVYGTYRVTSLHANFSPTSVCLPFPICFQNLTTDLFANDSLYLWDFGDGTTDTSRAPCHTYTAPGIYTVCLRVINNYGCKDSVCKQVTVSAGVNLNLSIDTFLCPGHQVCVRNYSTGISLSWVWDVPDAVGTTHFTTATPCFSFANVGDYPVYMQVSSGSSCTSYDTFTVHNRYPVAAGYVSNNHLACPYPLEILQFHDTSQYGNASAVWYFGDGNISHFSQTSYVYTNPGTYIDTLCVTDSFGCMSCAIIDTVQVDGPYGNAMYTPAGICACHGQVDYTINTVNASQVTLVYGCNTGFSQDTTINPIGVPGNPSVVHIMVPYCILDTCIPQVVFGDASGCRVPLNLPQIPIDSPDVRFTFDNFGVCLNGTVCFNDVTYYSLPIWYDSTIHRTWDFGDGTIDSTSNNPSPCHYYGAPGGYAAKLYVWSLLGCVDSSVNSVVVVPTYPIAGFYGDDTLKCAYSPACFHDTSQIYYLTSAWFRVWNWGDGHIDTVYTADACHAYTTGGYYNVTMCVYDSIGCGDCDSIPWTIRIIDNPIANAGGDHAVCYGQVTQLHGSGGTQCHWFPGTLVSDSTDCNPTILAFVDTNIVLIVTDQYFCADTDTVRLSVAGVTANFNVGASFCQDDSVCPVDASTNYNGVLSTWLYDFGNGDTVNAGPNICYKYPVDGTYTITLTVLDATGCYDTASASVIIFPSPTAAFSLNDSVICSDQQVCVTDLSTSVGPITSWVWNYGEGANVSGQAPPCHTYIPPYFPTYTVSLFVTDQNGCKDTAYIPLTLNEIPRADFTWTTSCETDAMPLASTSIQGDAAIVSYEWLFWVGAPNPVTDANQNTSFQFPAGTYPVQLVVRDANGCSDTIVKTVQSDSLSQLVIYPGDTTICLGTAVEYTVSGVFDHITWTPSTYLSSTTSAHVIITPQANIGYIVSATNGVCTAASDTFVIRTIQSLPLEVTATPDHVVLGLSSNLLATVPAPIDSVIWSPDATLDCRDCPNPIALPTQTTTYTATAYYSYNGATCSTEASATIYVIDVCDNSIVYVPNTFTPNGDGLNDVFMIRGLAATKINYLRIFDRWGKMVFEATGGAPNDPTYGWDGTDRGGQKLNSAVYVYTYEIECINGDIVNGKGNVTLVR